jgi:hypothetical protein
VSEGSVVHESQASESESSGEDSGDEEGDESSGEEDWSGEGRRWRATQSTRRHKACAKHGTRRPLRTNGLGTQATL